MTASGTASWTIPARPAGGPRRLSFPQERLFLLDRIMPGLPAYNVPTVVRVGTTLNADLLARALDIIVARHDVLRTTIRLIDGVPLAEVSPEGSVQLTVCDLRSTPEFERVPRTERFLAELARQPFDLARDVLLRAGLVHVDVDEDLLLVVLHHSASDHSSSALLFSELDTAYEALRAGDEPDLPALPIQYADFADWQRDRLSGGLLDDLVEYWTGQLAGAPERLELPIDRPRPSVQSYRGRRREFEIGAALVEPLRELARREGVSLFMVLLAAFKTLLHRYTAVSDLMVGVPVSGRHHVETTPLLGLFSNTLVLRSDFSADPRFTELLAAVKLTTRAAQAHQELPFEKLVEVLNPERAQSHSPLFQVFFGFDVAPAQPPTLAGCVLERLPVPGWEWARFDLSMVLRELPDGALDARLEYATDLFDETRIERMVGHFESLLKSVGADAEQRVSMLPLLTAEERRRLLVEWNATQRSYGGRCVHELFAEQAARSPDLVAVVSERERLTYGELDRRSNQLARELLRVGAGAGALVGICAERSVEVLVALLGVLKSGAAYVPIDPGFPAERQQFMLADARVRVLLTQERLVGGIDPGDATVLCLDRDWEQIAGHSDQAPAVAYDPEGAAYVIYTSGSTGRPKGVRISHRALVNFLMAMREAPGLGAEDVLLAVTTLSFDIAGLELYLPLIVGARVVITPSEAALDGVELADWLARSGATVMQATPTTWQLLVDAGWAGDAALKILCGGEALTRALADKLLERGASLWQLYGPTETTIWSSVLALERGDGPTPLGGPIANTSFYVLDDARQPLPVGVTGELYIAGDGVALGYHERPELSAEKFLPNPFAPAGGRVYRTGDLVRWREDATLEFHGRVDGQIKLRGFRIELGEIETVLAGQPGVSVAVATVREDAPGDRRLIAYIVPAHGDPPNIDALRRLLKAKLPAFMVPSGFVTLDALPMTANGKLDRNALPPPDGARPDLGRSYAAPETPVQKSLAAIWCEALVLDRVGIDDDFFDLGGHSLLAVRVFSEIERTLGARIPLVALFESATIAHLAEIVERDLSAERSTWNSVVQIQHGDHGSPFFLIPWLDGELLGYRDLVEHFPDDLALYGLMAPGVDGRRVPLRTIESMASHYLKEIRRVQPQGPYYFGGFCFAGVVAYEMGRQLIERDEEPGMVALIDAYWHGSRRPSRLDLERVKWAAYRQANLRGKLVWVRRRLIRLRNRMRKELYERSGALALHVLAHSRLHPPARPWDLMLIAGTRAAKRYAPKPSDVRMHFFRAQLGPGEEGTPWERLAGGGVVLHPVIGPEITHVTILKEQGAPTLAREIARALNELEMPDNVPVQAASRRDS